MRLLLMICLVGACKLATGQTLSAPPAWMTAFPVFQNKTVKEWGQYDTIVTYRDIVKMKTITTFFGIKGDASGEGGGAGVFLTDPKADANGLIYGAYSNLSSSFNQETSWAAPMSNYSLLWGDYEARLNSTQYRTRAHHIEDLASSNNSTITFKAWSLVQVPVRVTAITFGQTLLKDLKFAVPGIYKGFGSDQSYITEKDFKTIYKISNEFDWVNTGQHYYGDPNLSVMAMETDGRVEIRDGSNGGSWELALGDHNEFVLDVWGKMLTRNQEVEYPFINPSYNYGLWVAGEMVSEDFIMQPRANWADDVFDTCHNLIDLKELESYIKEHRHLPGIPTTADVKKGYTQHDINRKLLGKIEELTLYKIGQHKDSKKMELELQDQGRRIAELKEKLKKSLQPSN